MTINDTDFDSLGRGYCGHDGQSVGGLSDDKFISKHLRYISEVRVIMWPESLYLSFCCVDEVAQNFMYGIS